MYKNDNNNKTIKTIMYKNDKFFLFFYWSKIYFYQRKNSV